MSPLEAAQRLAGPDLNRSLGGRVACPWCIEFYGQHAPDCPILALPRIVAALEAIALLDNDEYWRHGEWCGPGVPGDIARYALGLPIEDWSRAAIMAALKGNAPPA